MEADPDRVRVTPSPGGDTYLVEWRGTVDAPVARYHVGRSADRTHWLIYDPSGVALVRSPHRERAIEFAVHLAQGGPSVPIEPVRRLATSRRHVGIDCMDALAR
jgi:hypothetical protein